MKNAAEKVVEKLRRAQLIDTDALRKLCKSATPGPWHVDSYAPGLNEISTYTGKFSGDVIGSPQDDGWRVPSISDNDAAYIAAANPATVLQLLDEIDRLRAIEAAARNLAKVKGRHHSELAMNKLLESLK